MNTPPKNKAIIKRYLNNLLDLDDSKLSSFSKVKNEEKQFKLNLISNLNESLDKVSDYIYEDLDDIDKYNRDNQYNMY